MAIGDHSPMREAFDRALAHVDKIMDGDATAFRSAPWHDSAFQHAVMQRLRESAHYREEARKLAIVKEVFGGSK